MRRKKHDLVIVGGGPAGISTALHVERHAPELAERMVVLEKERYPRDKYCAGAIGARAERILEAIGVRVDVPSVPIHAVSLRFGDETVLVREGNLGRVVRRIEYDHALAQQAVARGIEVQDGTPVAGVETVRSGVRVKLEGGEVLEARAVVGADGVSGPVRRTAGFAESLLRAQVWELDTEPAPGDPPDDALHFDFRYRDFNGYLWDFPTLVDGERKVCRGAYFIRGPKGEDVRGRLRDYLAARGLDIGKYRLKPYAERGYEPGQPISCPHVLLVGEAAGIDIATGEGIPQAIAYGSLAGSYLAAAFRAGALSFRDWRDRVDAASFGRRLFWRHVAYRMFYGEERQVVEALTASAPGLIRSGCQDFAGRPRSPGPVARGLLQFAPRALRYFPGALLRILRRRAQAGTGSSS